MSLQSKFLSFHGKILLANTDENATLRDKRDNVLRRMRDKGLTFAPFNQGSYAMGTGVKPVRTDYDIDVGVVFSGKRPEDPLATKRAVRDALHGFTKSVEWRRHCIRVQYTKEGESIYHVDVAIYWEDAGKRLALAVGKEGSTGVHKEWEPADPKGFLEKVTNRHSGNDAAQFRRVVRYLKRWKDVHFAIEGNAAPVGVGLTVAGLTRFAPARPWSAQTEADYDDLKALIDFVDGMRRGFQYVYHEGATALRLVERFPVEPGKDVFRKMTNQQMGEFKGRLDRLSGWLETARSSQQTGSLLQAFGEEFPA